MSKNPEIKFKAWDTARNEEFRVGEVYIELSGEVFLDVLEYKARDRFILRQFSGLYDSHSQEIYWGDKLRFMANPYSGVGVVCLGEYEEEAQHAHDIASFHYGWYVEFDHMIGGHTEKKKLSLFRVLNNRKGYGMSTHHGEVVGHIFKDPNRQ